MVAMRNALNKLRGEGEIAEVEPKKAKKKDKEGYTPKKSSVEPQLPERARSYRILDLNGERIETSNIEQGPGQHFMDLLRYFIEKYPDLRSEVRTLVNGDGVDLDDRLFIRVYVSVDENPEDLEGLDCCMVEDGLNETNVLVALKPGDAEILFPEGFRPWSAVKDEEGMPTVIATAEENEKYSKLFAKQLEAKRAAKQAARASEPEPAPAEPQAEPEPAEDTPKPAPKKGNKKS